MSTLEILESERAHIQSLLASLDLAEKTEEEGISKELSDMGIRHIKTLNSTVFGPIREALQNTFHSQIVLGLPDGLLNPEEFLARGKKVYIPLQVMAETDVDLSVDEDSDEEERTLEDVITDELNLIAQKYSVLVVPGRFVHAEIAVFDDVEEGEEITVPSFNYLAFFETDIDVFPFPVPEEAPRWLATAMNDIEIEENEGVKASMAEKAAEAKKAKETQAEIEAKKAEEDRIAQEASDAKAKADKDAADAKAEEDRIAKEKLDAEAKANLERASSNGAAVNNAQGANAAEQTDSKPNAKPQTPSSNTTKK